VILSVIFVLNLLLPGVHSLNYCDLIIGRRYSPSLRPRAVAWSNYSADLSLDRHVSVVSLASFYWLWQLRRVRRSLDNELAAILVYIFVTSRVDYCNLLLAGAPKSVTDKLQWVMSAVARVVSSTKKYDRSLTHLLHSELHLLDVANLVTYKLGITVAKHRLSVWAVHTSCSSCWTTAPSFCQPPSTVLDVPRSQLVTPLMSLDQRHGTCSKTICMSRTHKLTVFVVHWRRFFLISIRHIERIRGVFATMRYINWHLHYIYNTLCVCDMYAVSLCGQLKPEMQLLPTTTSRVPLIESEQYVTLWHCQAFIRQTQC